MIRVTLISHTREEVVLKVEGWVSGENVTVLEQESRRWLPKSKRLVLDLAGVKFIDGRGVALLRCWKGELVLRGESPFVHMLLDQA